MPDRLLFIPGRGCKASEHYPKTWMALEAAGFVVDEVIPPWGTTFENLITQTGRQIAKSIGQNAIVLAHSFGVNVAQPELARQATMGVILTSPGVACAEGIEGEAGRSLVDKHFPAQAKFVSQFSLAALARAMRLPPERAAVIVGEIEARDFPFMNDMAHIAARALGVQVTYAPEAPHFIDYSEQYIRAVVEAAVHVRESRM